MLQHFKNGYKDKDSEIIDNYYKPDPDASEPQSKKRKKKDKKKKQEPSSTAEQKLEIDCKICFSNQSSDHNLIIYCDK